MNNDFKIHFTDGTTLMHYGKPRRSGRFKWGSGKRPYQGDPEYAKVRLKGNEKREIKRLNKMGAANYPDFYDRLSPAQRNAIEKGIQAGKVSEDFKSKYETSKSGAGDRAQKRKEEEIKRKMEADPSYKEAKEAFDVAQKNIKSFDDFDKMLQLADIETVRKLCNEAIEDGWASKEFATGFKTWDFVKNYYENEYDFFAVPDVIRQDMDGAIKKIEDRYFKNGEFVSTGDRYLDINIPDAHWRLLAENDPNVSKYVYPSTVKYFETHIDELAKRLNVSEDKAKEELEKMKKL